MFLLVESIIGIRGKQFSKKELIIAAGQLIFWQVETIFVCVCVCVCVFQGLLPVKVFFLSSGTDVSRKSFRLVEKL